MPLAALAEPYSNQRTDNLRPFLQCCLAPLTEFRKGDIRETGPQRIQIIGHRRRLQGRYAGGASPPIRGSSSNGIFIRPWRLGNTTLVKLRFPHMAPGRGIVNGMAGLSESLSNLVHPVNPVGISGNGRGARPREHDGLPEHPRTKNNVRTGGLPVLTLGMTGSPYATLFITVLFLPPLTENPQFQRVVKDQAVPGEAEASSNSISLTPILPRYVSEQSVRSWQHQYLHQAHPEM